MQKLYSVAVVTLLASLAMENIVQCEAAPAESDRVKRQNIQGLVIPREFQNINFESYLKNPRAVQFQLKCVIYDGPCDSIGKYLKANFPNWLSTQCKNCNANQKAQAGKAISFFQQNYPKEWMDGVKKYRGTFTDEDVRRFESELGIKIQTSIPEGGAPVKPDTDGLAALAGAVIKAAKSTTEPLVFESRTAADAPVAPSVASSTAVEDTATTTNIEAVTEAPQS